MAKNEKEMLKVSLEIEGVESLTKYDELKGFYQLTLPIF